VLWEVQLDLAAHDQSSDSVWQRSVPCSLFTLLSGNDGLSGYQFFANSAHHFFCVRCSAHAFSHRLDDGPELYTIDLRSLHADRAPGSSERAAGRRASIAAHRPSG
jgi:hypothetical protein